MLDFSRLALTASTVLVALATLAYLVVLTSRRAPVKSARPARQKALVGAGAPVDDAVDPDEALPAAPTRDGGHGTLWYAARLVDVAFAVLTAGLIARMIAVGHAPFSNQYEFACSFAWGVLLAHEIFHYRFRIHALSLLVLPIALGMMIYADTNNSAAMPLVPALQNAWLLPLHVITATVAYGAAAVAFGCAVLYLVQPKLRLRGIPSQAKLDEVAYRAVIFSFPLMTIMIILGAVWANIAWGTYWSWDPKETAALLTWLIYGGYLHARVMRDWRGNKAAWLLILGFAAILFTFFGNLFFGGLHSYGSQ